MRLQPSRLIRQQGIGGRVALVEAIARELVDQVEQLVRRLRRDLVMLAAALDEGLALRIHFGLDLLAHRAAQEVGAAETVARQYLRRLHHLFLIDEDAVGLDRKSTRLNQSLMRISYAVFCLKKKKTKTATK